MGKVGNFLENDYDIFLNEFESSWLDSERDNYNILENWLDGF